MLIVEKLLKEWLNNIITHRRNLGLRYFPLLSNSTWRKKSSVNEHGNHCFQLWKLCTSKKFHLLFVHDGNKSNNGKIGQVVAMGGSGKTQDFFLCIIKP
jgi:hypothetical protein